MRVPERGLLRSHLKVRGPSRATLNGSQLSAATVHGATVTVSFDTNTGNLSLSDGTGDEVAYTNLYETKGGEDFFPAFSLYENGDKLTLAASSGSWISQALPQLVCDCCTLQVVLSRVVVVMAPLRQLTQCAMTLRIVSCRCLMHSRRRRARCEALLPLARRAVA